MHQALYRKWRPQTFDDVCGQEHITSILKYEADHAAFSHAYLFCGSRGTGKTTCAKILAKVVNCEHPVNGSPCGECAACRAISTASSMVYAPSSTPGKIWLCRSTIMMYPFLVDS